MLSFTCCYLCTSICSTSFSNIGIKDTDHSTWETIPWTFPLNRRGHKQPVPNTARTNERPWSDYCTSRNAKTKKRKRNVTSHCELLEPLSPPSRFNIQQNGIVYITTSLLIKNNTSDESPTRSGMCVRITTTTIHLLFLLNQKEAQQCDVNSLISDRVVTHGS